ncbi:TPA: helix-turn-helix domain-containing protein, partial [Staphylococcus aureus]|nr:helix-turn-helix domain-containing protein [Staphylococcus aureus]
MKKRKKRKELDYKTRLAIAKYLNDGLNIIQISKILGRDDAVLYREVNKRSVDGVYNPLLAEEDAIKSRSISDEQVAKRRRLNDETKAYIEEKLSLKWSPRQIASQIEKDTGYYISYPTIYRYIRNGLVKVDVKRDMRQAGKKYNKSS